MNNTLINYEKNKSNTNNNIFNLRPGLISFLNTLKPIYELISFTNESKEISDKYLNEIKCNKKYFDFNLYKEHNILIGRNLVKDISKIVGCNDFVVKTVLDLYKVSTEERI